MFSLNPYAGSVPELKKIDKDKEFSPEFEALLEKYQKEKEL